MEDASIKAIVIGVSLFIIVFTLTAILMYFNTARSILDTVSLREDIASSYERAVNESRFEGTLSGVQVISLINKYAGDENVSIDVIYDDVLYRDVNNTWTKVISKDNHVIVSKEKLDFINPVWNNNVVKEENNGIKYTVTLNVND